MSILEHDHCIVEFSGVVDKILKICDRYQSKNFITVHSENKANYLSGEYLKSKIISIGNVLQKNVQSQETVLIILPQGVEYIYTLLACLYANVIAVPFPLIDFVDEKQIVEKIQYIMTDSKARCVVTINELKGYLTGIEFSDITIISIDNIVDENNYSLVQRRNYQSNDLAIILYTSGSTNNPKGVMISHQNLMSRVSVSVKQWKITKNSILVSWLPQFHSFALDFNLFVPLIKGASSIIISPSHFISKPETWFETIHKYKATHTASPNFAFDYAYSTIDMSSAKNYSLGSVQAIISGGEPIRKESYEKFYNKYKDLGLNLKALTPLYGMSEMGTITTKRLGKELKFLNLDLQSLEEGSVKITSTNLKSKSIISCGHIGKEAEIVIVNPDTCERCPSDKVGEVWVNSPSVAVGYFNRKEESENTFLGMLKDSTMKYLRTGDLGFIHNNELFLVGREKELIIINGKNHFPTDIEWTIKRKIASELPTCVFSLDIENSEKVIVIQEIKLPSNENEYANLANQMVASVSEVHGILIEDIVFVKKDAMPKSGSGKIVRKECRNYYKDVKFSPLYQHKINSKKEPYSFSQEYIKSYIVQYISKECEIESNFININKSIYYYGQNPSFLMKFILDLERHFIKRISATDIIKHNTIELLSTYLSDN